MAISAPPDHPFGELVALCSRRLRYPQQQILDPPMKHQLERVTHDPDQVILNLLQFVCVTN